MPVIMPPHPPGPPCCVSEKLLTTPDRRSFIVDLRSVIAVKGWEKVWCLVSLSEEFEKFVLTFRVVVTNC